MTTTRRALRPVAVAALVAASLGTLTACGAEEQTPAAGDEPRQQVSEESFSSARDAYDVKLAGCLRSKGHDVADPAPGQGIQESSPAINASASECMRELGDPPAVVRSKADEAEMLKQQLAEAECLREKGYEVEDPAGGALVIPEDATEADMNACVGR